MGGTPAEGAEDGGPDPPPAPLLNRLRILACSSLLVGVGRRHGGGRQAGVALLDGDMEWGGSAGGGGRGEGLQTGGG